MTKTRFFLLAAALAGIISAASGMPSKLRPNPYSELPLGSIKPQGWLREMLVAQKNGATGKLDALYPLVMGPTNGWLGGEGDQWERGPYWIDGLLPLGYILGDEALIAKAKPWIEWAIASQKPDGYFGPEKDYENNIVGVQRDNCGDWWPKMVMLKVLQQYYSATGDRRVVDLMTRYFRYQLNTLPSKPLDHWTFWARYRGGDNLMMVYWLYGVTGEKFLLDLGDLIYSQTFPFDKVFTESNWWHTGSMHCVNLAQGMKAPAVYYQRTGDKRLLDVSKKALRDINNHISGPHGAIIGDEALHGNNPTQGAELCTVVEMMFSLETMLRITGDMEYASQLERLAFNALPTQSSDNYQTRQYFQQINQVEISRRDRNFDTNHGGTTTCFGLLTGYPCCTSNMHQGWPKFTQNLFYSTPDGGLAALVYAPSTVSATVGKGTAVKIRETTSYPFEESVRFEFEIQDATVFPFRLRIPEWCSSPEARLNGKPLPIKTENGIASIDRKWQDGDILTLTLPMQVRLSTWYERSRSVERGPLVYALRLKENWKWSENVPENGRFGKGFWEVSTDSQWNYALVDAPDDKLQEQYRVKTLSPASAYPWSLAGAPIQITAKGRRVPQWGLYNGSAGPLPYSIAHSVYNPSPEEDIILIPYGCTTLRITEFPILGQYSIK